MTATEDTTASNEFRSFLRGMAACQNLEDAWQLAGNAARETGFVHLSYYRHDEMSLGNVRAAEDFARGEDEAPAEGMRLAPDNAREGLSRSWMNSRPFRWSQKAATELWGNERVSDIVRFAHVSDGNIALPVFGPMTHNGFFFGVYGKDATRRTIDEMVLHAKLQQLHARLCDMEIGTRPQASLSAMEKRVLERICAGLRSSEVAKLLNISPHTVNTYLKRAYEKLGVNDRASAAVKAFRGGCLL